jgi:hypothetical protein
MESMQRHDDERDQGEKEWRERSEESFAVDGN